MSNLTIFALSVTTTEMLADVKRIVLPSGGASTVSCAAMMPLAPVRLSTMKFCPMLFWNAELKSRAWMSVPPPGGKGTSMRTVLSGHCCANDGADKTGNAKATAKSATTFVLIRTSSLYWNIAERGVIKAPIRRTVASAGLSAGLRQTARRQQRQRSTVPAMLLCVSRGFEVVAERVAREGDGGPRLRHAPPRPAPVLLIEREIVVPGGNCGGRLPERRARCGRDA